MTIIENMSNADYHSHDSVSKSQLDIINRSPFHLRYAAPREATRGMEMGTAIHTAILEPERFANEYMLLKGVDDRRSSAYKEAVKIYGSERVLTGPESDKVSGMQESVLSNHYAMEILGHPNCRKELSVFATDPVTGLAVRCRFDAIAGLRAIDLKKTQDIRASEFARSVINYRYHVQAAFYTDVWLWETGENLERFEFLAVEEQCPNASKIWRFPADVLEYGRRQYRADLNRYAECLNSGEWPAINQESEVLDMPGWFINQIESEMDDSEFTFTEE